MSSKMKNFWLICAKQALNAVLMNSALVAMMHSTFNTYSTSGLWNLGKATLSVIVAREIMIWGPIVLNWSSTNADPGSIVLTKISNGGK